MTHVDYVNAPECHALGELEEHADLLGLVEALRRVGEDLPLLRLLQAEGTVSRLQAGCRQGGVGWG